MEGKWDARFAGAIPHDGSYYSKCLLGGMLACGLTHTFMCPVDVAKVSMQVNPKKYKGLAKSMSLIRAENGLAGLSRGWLATAFGYSAQGMFKFGLNEVFKDQYANMVGKENSVKYRGLLWAASAASAEFVADIFLCPFEMVKVKQQTAFEFPAKFSAAWAAMSADRANTRFPFGSLTPLWSRQIPYTVAKFVGFEFVVEQFYTHVFTQPKDSYPKSTQLAVTFSSGYIAGVFCAIVSQPADNLVSQMGKAENKGKGFGAIASEVGMRNLFLSGLGARIFMIGTLTGLQWYIYDTWKVFTGLGTTGGAVVKK